MKKWHGPISKLINLTLANIVVGSSVYAGSFSLYTEDNGYAIGNFAAGIAAEALDASTGWYNPAGLVLLEKQQAILGGVGVFPVGYLSGTSTYRTNSFLTRLPYVENFHNLKSNYNALVPSFHYAYPWSNDLVFGFSVVSPFGLTTKWSDHGPVRYASTESQLLTVNIAPEVGFNLNQYLSLGAGLDVQYAQVKFNQIVGAPALLLAFDTLLDLNIPVNALDSLSYNKGDSWGVGFHVGILGKFNNNHTRIGLNYQAPMSHKFHGYSRLTGRLADPDFRITDDNTFLTANPLAVARSNNLRSNDINFPGIVTLSGYHDVDDRLAVLGSVVYTAWGIFKTIQLNNVMAYNPETSTQATVDSVSPEYYHGAWRAALGANYRLNEKFMLRVGGGYDQTPTNKNRSVRIPDTNRWAASIGARYNINSNFIFDCGYTRLIGNNSSGIYRTDVLGTSTYNVTAKAHAYANLVGAQITWLIDDDKPVTK